MSAGKLGSLRLGAEFPPRRWTREIPILKIPPVNGPSRFSVIVVGGGLQGALLGLRLRGVAGVSVTLVERGHSLGGNHTWSFHEGDLTESQRKWLAPLVGHHWPSYEVRFPGLQRTIHSRYSSINSEHLNRYASSTLNASENVRLMLDVSVQHLEPRHVVLEGGQNLHADLVVDARGPEHYPATRVAYQKFVGLEVELSEAHHCNTVRLMDARMPQVDGFRFLYVLPLETRRLLIEDTYFTGDSSFDESLLTGRVLEYANANGWQVQRVLRTERGLLPLPLESRDVAMESGLIQAGYRGGWFHPVTGYSLPLAVRFADTVAQAIASPSWMDTLHAATGTQRRQFRFGVLLNQLLYGAFAPEDRWNVLERFYRLPEATISRFYASQMTLHDKARILCGRPPRRFSFQRMLAGAPPQ